MKINLKTQKIYIKSTMILLDKKYLGNLKINNGKIFIKIFYINKQNTQKN